MNSRIIQGNNADVLRTFPDNHFDSIVTDPPYGIAFLGKDWDSRKASETTSKIAQLHNLPSGMKHTSLADDLEFQYWMRDVFAECLRVLKPGGHILAFSAARTYHHMAMAAQTAGFEIRDQIMWIYSSGFPKSQDVGKSIQRSLGVKEKKAIPKEKQTKTAGFANNGAQEKDAWSGETTVCTDPEARAWEGWGTQLKPAHEPIVLARKPIKLSIAKNCQAWGVGALHIDATRIPVEGLDTRGGGSNGISRLTFGEGITSNEDSHIGYEANELGRFPSNVVGEIEEPYQKYFYCPKVGRAERHIGHNQDDTGNNHPTVKPIELMKYLIQLVTPPGGRVLDPFNGSGSTGCAAVELDYDYTGIELDEKYVTIAEKRIAAWYRATHNADFDQVFEIDKD